MSNKQLICDECGDTYAYEDHKTVYDCLNADCDGSLVPDEDNQGQNEETDESDISEDNSYREKIVSVQIDDEDAEWIDGSAETAGNAINFPSRELTAGDKRLAETDLLFRIKTAIMCCGERMLVARVGQQNVKQMEVSFTCGECETDMRFFVPRDEAEVIEFAEKLKQSQDQQPTMSNMLWT